MRRLVSKQSMWDESGADASPFKRKNVMGFMSPSGFLSVFYGAEEESIHSANSS